MEFEAQYTELAVANFNKFTREWKREVERHVNL